MGIESDGKQIVIVNSSFRSPCVNYPETYRSMDQALVKVSTFDTFAHLYKQFLTQETDYELRKLA